MTRLIQNLNANMATAIILTLASKQNFHITSHDIRTACERIETEGLVGTLTMDNNNIEISLVPVREYLTAVQLDKFMGE